MMYYGYDSYWPLGILGGLFQALIVILVIVFIVRLLRWGGMSRRDWRNGRNWRWQDPSAEDILRERFAKGEISREEYEERLRVLRNDRNDGPGGASAAGASGAKTS